MRASKTEDSIDDYVPRTVRTHMFYYGIDLRLGLTAGQSKNILNNLTAKILRVILGGLHNSN